jgi:aminoglycoside 6'-N-acetyltransferase
MEFIFRRLTRNDFALLSTWLAREHVRKWWKHDPSAEAVEDDFGGGVDGTDHVGYFIVALAGQPIGFIQHCVLSNEPDWYRALQVVSAPPDAMTIDYFIGEAELVGRGIGTAMIGAFIDETLAAYPNCPMMVVDIDPQNRPSWRALEANGFTHVWTGVLEIDEPDNGLAWVFQRCF